jgi:hypothetical protein
MAKRDVRFRNRITVERNVISVLNAAFADVEPIAALSLPAIQRWSSGVRVRHPLQLVDSVISLLQELSEQLKIETDNSREVFDSGLRDPTKSTEMLIDKIKNLSPTSARPCEAFTETIISAGQTT